MNVYARNQQELMWELLKAPPTAPGVTLETAGWENLASVERRTGQKLFCDWRLQRYGSIEEWIRRDFDPVATTS